MGKKRASSPSRADDGAQNKTEVAPSAVARAGQEGGDAEMGEFEDQWEDEFESEESDEDEEAGEEEGEEGGEYAVMEVEGERAASPEPYLPTGVLAEGEELQPDLSTYPLLHSFVPTWPSLSFDVLFDKDGNERKGFPVSCALVAGTQAQDSTANELTIMRWESLGKTRRDDLEDSDSDDDDDDADDEQPVLNFRAIPHRGCVNRVRARPVASGSSGPPVPPDPYYVATFSETGKVHIFDVAPQLDSLLSPGSSSGTPSKLPFCTIDSHGRGEGYALDWAPPIGEQTSRRLLSGDVYSKIFLTTMTETAFTPSPRPFTGHTSSVEDLQWSPTEPTVFASCSADKSIRVWDTRVKDRRNVLGISGAHAQDVNVISWNRLTNYLLVSGGDEGELKVWDLRNLKGSKAPAPSPVAAFAWHTAPVTSVEWHPTDSSCFAASGSDNQVSLWDLSVEADEDEAPATGLMKDVPAQLLFVHQGQKDIKEVHWHPQIPGVVMSTALDGFNIFKSLPFA